MPDIDAVRAARKRPRSSAVVHNPAAAPSGWACHRWGSCSPSVDRERFRPSHVRSIHADDDTVIVVWDGHGVANDGQPYENSDAWIMHLHGGMVVDGTAGGESISFNDLWTRIQP